MTDRTHAAGPVSRPGVRHITWVYRLLVDTGFAPHVRAIREDVAARRQGTRARRWVVERTHSWLNRFRALLVRWDKKTTNYEGSLHLACA